MMLVSACSADAGFGAVEAETHSRGPTESVGAISMQLALPGGAVLDVLRWSVTQAGGAELRSGSLDVSNRPAVSLVIGDLPAGPGLRIALSGSAAGGVSCAGSADFDIDDGHTTQVPVLLACTVVALPAPATPPWGVWVLAIGLAASGIMAARHRQRRSAAIGCGTLAFLAMAPAQMTGCSSDDTAQSASGSAESTGSVGIALTLPDGKSIDSIHWTITGPNGAPTTVQQGSVDVLDSTRIRILVAGLPGGSSYAVALRGTSTDGVSICAGAASFSVSPRTTTSVTVVLDCSSAPLEAGAAAISVQTYSCASVRGVTASASHAVVGGSVNLSAFAAGLDPSALTYAWSAPSGSFASPAAAATAFTCTQAGTVPITLRVSDGPIPDGGSCDEAASTLVLLVTCTPADGGAS